MVRVGPERYAAALAQPHAREIDFTGRPMTGMVMVAAAEIARSLGASSPTHRPCGTPRQPLASFGLRLLVRQVI